MRQAVTSNVSGIPLNYAAPSGSRRWSALIPAAVGVGMASLLYLAPRIAVARGHDYALLYTLASSPWMETGNADIMLYGLFPFWIIIGICAGTARFRISRIAFPALIASHVLYMAGIWYLVSEFGTDWYFFRDLLDPITALATSLYLIGLTLLWLFFLKTNRAARMPVVSPVH